MQGKLEEVKAYILAVKEATDASAREKLGQQAEEPKAIVKSWLEFGGEK